MAALWPRINVSLQAVAQILLVICLGVWLTARRNLDKKALAAVSSVNWHVLIPALMFSSIVGAVTPTGLLLLWPLLVLSLVHVVLGALPALLLCCLTRLPRDLSFFAVMAASLPNCGNLPWLFMPTIIRYYTPADQVAAQVQYSTGLTSVYTIMIVVITLTVPFLFKKPPDTLVLPRDSSSTASRAVPQGQQVVSRPGLIGSEAEGHVQQCQQQRQQQQQMQQQGKDPLQCVQVQEDHQQQGVMPWGTSANGGALQEAGSMQHGVNTSSNISSSSSSSSSNSSSSCDRASGSTAHPFLDEPQQQLSSQLNAQQQLQRLPAQSPLNTAANAALPHSLHAIVSNSTAAVQNCTTAPHTAHQQDAFDVDIRDSPWARQPSVGGAASFSSHRSNSLLLSRSSSLLGSFSRSFSRGVNHGLKRSASWVQLVWSYPTGWQLQREASAAGGSRQSRAAGPAMRPAWLQRLSAMWAAVLAHPVVNLPLGATVAGMACAAVGPVRGLLVNELASLHWLWLGLSWVGGAAAPLATLQIGAELMQAAPVSGVMHVSRRAQRAANCIAITVKLVVVPLANIALLRLAGLAQLVPATDSVYQLLMLVEASVPAAVTLLVVCSRVYPDIRPLSSMLFWQYVASLFTLPAFLVWYLYMLEL